MDIHATYNNLAAKGEVSLREFLAALAGEPYSDTNPYILSWWNDESRVKIDPNVDLSTLIPVAMNGKGQTVGRDELKAAGPILSILMLRELSCSHGYVPKDERKALLAFQKYGSIDLPVWKLGQSDPIGKQLVAEVIAEIHHNKVEEAAYLAAMTVRYRAWVKKHDLEQRLDAETGIPQIPFEKLLQLPREVQEDVVALQMAGIDVVDLTGHQKGASLPWLPGEVFNAIVSGVWFLPEFWEVEVKLTSPEWAKVRRSVRQMAENPIGWIAGGKDRESRRKRALVINLKHFLEDGIVPGAGAPGNSEDVERTIRLCNSLVEIDVDELADEMDALPNWSRIVLVRNGGAVQDKVYEALKVLRKQQ